MTVVGVALVLHRLSEVQDRLVDLQHRVARLDAKVDRLLIDSYRAMLREVQLLISNSHMFLAELSADKPCSEETLLVVGGHINHLAAALNDLVPRLTAANTTELPLDLVVYARNVYFDLVQAYALARKEAGSLAPHAEMLREQVARIDAGFRTRAMLSHIYLDCMRAGDGALTQDEALAIVGAVACGERGEAVRNQIELLAATPTEELLRWEDLLAQLPGDATHVLIGCQSA